MTLKMLHTICIFVLIIFNTKLMKYYLTMRFLWQLEITKAKEICLIIYIYLANNTITLHQSLSPCRVEEK